MHRSDKGSGLLVNRGEARRRQLSDCSRRPHFGDEGHTSVKRLLRAAVWNQRRTVRQRVLGVPSCLRDRVRALSSLLPAQNRSRDHLRSVRSHLFCASVGPGSVVNRCWPHFAELLAKYETDKGKSGEEGRDLRQDFARSRTNGQCCNRWRIPQQKLAIRFSSGQVCDLLH